MNKSFTVNPHRRGNSRFSSFLDLLLVVTTGSKFWGKGKRFCLWPNIFHFMPQLAALTWSRRRNYPLVLLVRIPLARKKEKRLKLEQETKRHASLSSNTKNDIFKKTVYSSFILRVVSMDHDPSSLLVVNCKLASEKAIPKFRIQHRARICRIWLLELFVFVSKEIFPLSKWSNDLITE